MQHDKKQESQEINCLNIAKTNLWFLLLCKCIKKIYVTKNILKFLAI